MKYETQRRSGSKFALAVCLLVAVVGCSTIARDGGDVRPVKLVLKVVKADSEETNGESGYASNVVDENPSTIWHTQWHDKTPGFPHEIVLELIPAATIKGFSYLSRQDASDHGDIKDFEFYASTDGTNFGQPVKKGAFDTGKDEKIETFAPVRCRFIKLKALSEVNGLPWASADEIRIFQPGEPATPKKYRPITPGVVPTEFAFEQPHIVGDDFLNGFKSMTRITAIRPQVNETSCRIQVPPQSTRRLRPGNPDSARSIDRPMIGFW